MLSIIKNLNLKRIELIDFGQIAFYIGIFFLPSALPVSLFFLLISIAIIITIKGCKFFIKRDLWPLYLASFFILFSTFYSTYLSKPDELINFDTSTSWVSIFNWIPLFIAYRAFQPYLKSEKKKLIFINILLSGTFPVIFSIIGQIIFRWEGPFSTLGNSIIWFHKPINFENYNAVQGIAGLFSNPNYAAYWLATVFPFSIFLIKSKTKFFEKFCSLILIIFFISCIILTDSRNGFFGIFVAAGFILGFKFILICILSLFALSILYLITKSFLPLVLIEFVEAFVQRGLILKLTNFKFENFGQLERLTNLKITLKLIFLKPIFGWLAGSFPLIFILFASLNNNKIQHAHNLILQLAYDYGLLTAILIFSFISYLYVNASKCFFINQKKSINLIVFKSWMASSFISIFFHLTDIPYYDGKISILFWIFLSGIKTYIDQDYVSDKSSNTIF